MQRGGSSGGSGLIVAACMLAGGIVSIVTRDSDRKGGNVALIVIFAVAAIVGFTARGFYASKDLVMWSSWCLINAAVAVLSMFTQQNKSKN